MPAIGGWYASLIFFLCLQIVASVIRYGVRGLLVKRFGYDDLASFITLLTATAYCAILVYDYNVVDGLGSLPSSEVPTAGNKLDLIPRTLLFNSSTISTAFSSIIPLATTAAVSTGLLGSTATTTSAASSSFTVTSPSGFSTMVSPRYASGIPSSITSGISTSTSSSVRSGVVPSDISTGGYPWAAVSSGIPTGAYSSGAYPTGGYSSSGIPSEESGIPPVIKRIVNLAIISVNIYLIGTMFLKISLGVAYLRIFFARWQIYTIYSLMLISIIFTLFLVFYNIFQCGVPHGPLWLTYGACSSNAVFEGTFYAHAGWNAFADIVFATLPIFYLRSGSTNLSKREKITVGGILCLGSAGCLFTLVRIGWIKYLRTPLSESATRAPSLQVMSAAELSIGITCLALTTYRPLFKRFLSSRSSSQQKSDASFGFGSGSAREVALLSDKSHGGGNPGKSGDEIVFSQRALPNTSLEKDHDNYNDESEGIDLEDFRWQNDTVLLSDSECGASMRKGRRGRGPRKGMKASMLSDDDEQRGDGVVEQHSYDSLESADDGVHLQPRQIA